MTPKLARTIDFLSDRLRQAVDRNEPRLPPITTLAKEAHCAPVTLWKAARHLHQAGQCRVVPGGGIFVGERVEPMAPSNDGAPPPVAPATSMERTRRRIAEELLHGTLGRNGPLPSARQLAARYGVGLRSVLGALRTLADQGLLERKRRSYIVAGAGGRHAVSSIVVVSSSALRRMLPVTTSRTLEFWRSLERTCRQNNVRIVPSGLYDIADPDQACAAIANHARSEPALGFLCWSLAGDLSRVERLLKMLTKIDKPVAVVDETGAALHLAPRFAGGRTRFLHIATTPRSGEMVGRHLLKLGHRRVAFFQPLTGDPAYVRRCEGVRGVFAEAGLNDGVVDLHPEIEGTMGEAVAAGESFRKAREALGTLGSSRSDAAERPESMFLSMAEANLHGYAVVREFAQLLQPFFDQALADKSISAWVCGNDQMAMVAQAYLHRKKIPVPGRVSLIGFDDHPATFGMDLSSYSFNVGRVAELAVDHILSPRTTELFPSPSMELPGVVMHRGSLNRAPR